MCGVVIGFSSNVPPLASVLAISFPMMPNVHVLYGGGLCVGSSIFGVQLL